MKLDSQACPSFVEDINALVDDQLEQPDVTRLTDHVRRCEGCGDYLDTLRQLSALHRRTTDLLDEATVAAVDPAGLLARITGTLVEERRTSLARLFYGIGKAYVLAGNKRLPEERHRKVAPRAEAVSIPRAERQARCELREARGLERAGSGPRGNSLFGRSRKLFEASSWRESGALGKGRRFLEEALALDPAHDAARLYLGFQHYVTHRLDRARMEFRRVRRDARDPVHRLMALQWLGAVHAAAGDHGRATECFREVVEAAAPEQRARLLWAHVNLPVSCAKAGLAAEALDRFRSLVTHFPDALAEIKARLARMPAFERMLEQDADLRDALRRHVPVLFAA